MEYFRPEAVSAPEEIRTLQPYVIFTGTMDYFPNVDAVQFFCQEVLPLIRARVPNLRFVIAGRNPTALVMRLAADSAIVVTGSVPDIRPYLRGAAVAVAPMRIARGVQNKILEALAMDVPVVASLVAAEALPKTLALLLAAEAEPRAFAARVVDLVLNPPQRTGATRAFVKHYIDGLDLSSQLERTVRIAAGGQNSRIPEDQVEVAV
jgi:glycosyltransferase involved in cell wall biosynthesis